jgi:hypothetical protein
MPAYAFADLTGEEMTLEIISKGSVVNGTVGSGSSYRTEASTAL